MGNVQVVETIASSNACFASCHALSGVRDLVVEVEPEADRASSPWPSRTRASSSCSTTPRARAGRPSPPSPGSGSQSPWEEMASAAEDSPDLRDFQEKVRSLFILGECVPTEIHIRARLHE